MVDAGAMGTPPVDRRPDVASGVRPPGSRAVLAVEGLTTVLKNRDGLGQPVTDVTFAIDEGETLGLVGESGSGKSLLCLSILRLNPRPESRITSGSVWLEGESLLDLSPEEMRRVRADRFGMIVQDPLGALDPSFTVGFQLAELLRQRLGGSRRSARAAAVEAMRRVHLPDPASRMRHFPHQLSGGQRQRVIAAMALAPPPRVLIADEPTTSLDPTLRRELLDLLQATQIETGMAMLLVTHDFSVVQRACDRAAVMYAGRIVEVGPTSALISSPAHPYTVGLIASLPRGSRGTLYSIPGQPPSVFDIPRGCPFADRCPDVMTHCREALPPPFDLGEGRRVACWKFEQ